MRQDRDNIRPVAGQAATRSITITGPVFIGDTITAEVTVKSVHATRPVTEIAARITRQPGEVVLEGDVWCYTARPADSISSLA